MKKLLHKIFTGVCLLTILPAAVGCSSADEPAPPAEEPIDLYNPPYPEDAPVAKRTVLCYMLADNSLGYRDRDDADLMEMRAAIDAEGLNGCRLLVYKDAYEEEPMLVELTETGEEGLKWYHNDNVYSVDRERMEQVVKDMQGFAPADEYGLVLWSHGSGWQSTTSSRGVISRSFGDDRGKTMKVTSLAAALAGVSWSFIYFDCCNMATAEVAYQLRHITPVIVASATEIHADGMDYTLNVPVFTADVPDMTQAARNTFEHYDALSGNDRSCTISVIDTGVMDELAAATRAIMETGVANPSRSVLQNYMGTSSTVHDFGDWIERLDCDAALKEACLDALGRAIVYKAATPTVYLQYYIRINHYSGLGAWVPGSVADMTYRGYDELDWMIDVTSHNPLYNQPQ